MVGPTMGPGTPSRHLAARLALFYAAGFLVTGIKLPFWPVWLTGRGLDAHEIAALLAAGIWLNVAATPLVGAVADRLGRRRAAMAILAVVATLGYAGLSGVAGFWPIFGLALLAGAAQSALMPLGDSVTLAAVRHDGIDYGRVRVWGSVSFIAAAAASGALLGRSGGRGAGGDEVLLLVLATTALLAGACLAMPPDAPRQHGDARRWAAIGALAADRRFWRFVAVAAALQSSHQVYYGFGTLYWRSLGFSDEAIGVLWAEGVVAEIVLFWQGTRLLARIGPLGLMMLGGAAGIVRWGLMGLVPGLAAAFALQLLHALTFGAAHLGAMNYLSRTVPPSAGASAQALYAGASAGIGSGIVMLGAGALYGAFGGRAYLFMAALSAIGLAGAARLAASAAQRPHFG